MANSTTPSPASMAAWGGAVLSVGSIAWGGAMAWHGYDNEVARFTRNVLRRFDNPAPFKMP